MLNLSEIQKFYPDDDKYILLFKDYINQIF